MSLSAYTVTIHSTEGRIDHAITETKFDSFKAANAALLTLALSQHPEGGYNKCDVEVHHSLSGDSYRMRYDIEHPSREGAPDIAARIRQAASFRLNTERGQSFMSAMLSGDKLTEARETYSTWLARLSA